MKEVLRKGVALSAGAAILVGNISLEAKTAQAKPMDGGAPITRTANGDGGVGLNAAPSLDNHTKNIVVALGKNTIDKIAHQMYSLAGHTTCKEYQPETTDQGRDTVMTLCESKPDVSGSDNGIVMMDVITRNKSMDHAFAKPWDHASEVEVSVGKMDRNGEYYPETTDILQENSHGITADTQSGYFNSPKQVTYSASAFPRKHEATLTPGDVTATGNQMNKFMFHISMTDYFKPAFKEPTETIYPI